MKTAHSRACITLAALIWLSISLSFSSIASAENYPSRPIKLVDVFAPGGSTDAVARILAVPMGQSLDQAVVVENHPGAGGRVGIEFLTKSRPDGYTLFLGLTMAMAVNEALYKLPYDTAKGLAPISSVGTGAFIMVSKPLSDISSMQALITKAKQTPGKINYSSSGIGTGGHLFGELLKSRTGINIVHIPYNGVAPALTAVLSGEVSVGLVATASATQLVKAGRLKALAVTSARRSDILPEVPTTAEVGLADFDIVATYGVWGPAGLPQPVVDRLNTVIRHIVLKPEIKAKLSSLGVETKASSPDELESVLTGDIAKWGKVIRDAGIKAKE